MQILTKIGVLNVPDWWVAGKLSEEQTGISLRALLAVQLVLTGFVETKRWMDIRKPQSQAEKGSLLGFETAIAGTGDNGYPGGAFDPLGLSRCARGCACLACYVFDSQVVVLPVPGWRGEAALSMLRPGNATVRLG